MTTTLTDDVAPGGATSPHRPAPGLTRIGDGEAENVRVPGRLGAVVVAGRRALTNLRDPDAAVRSGELGRAMRTALTHYQQHATTTRDAARDTAGDAAGDTAGDAADLRRWERAAVSARVACAHLDAGNLTEVRLALDTAHDSLPHHTRNAVVAHAERDLGRRTAGSARAVSRAQQRGVSAAALLDQAVGVVAGHSEVSRSRARSAVHRHARHHRFVVSDLAADIVAGRVSPHAVVASSAERNPRQRSV